MFSVNCFFCSGVLIVAHQSDGGSNWSVWRAEKDLPNWKCCNYKLIRDMRIAPDGTGTMNVNPIPQRSGEAPELHTKDYGRHWSSE
jgi:hypothetical protein